MGSRAAGPFMRLLLIRHGKTEDRGRFARSGHADEFRPLSQEGRRDVRRAAGGLVRLVVQLDRLVSSPLVRAVETAAIFARAFPKARSTELSDLRPGGKLESISRWLETCSETETVGLVGHEPMLGRVASQMLCGRTNVRTFVSIKRGGVCLLEFATLARAGEGNLRWLLTPRQLRLLSPE